MASVDILLSNIRHNAVTLKSISHGAKLVAVVKANAYGHGANDVSATLTGIADMFAVAHLEEALEIKAYVGDTPILILSETVSAELLKACQTYGFHFVVYNTEGLSSLQQYQGQQVLSVWLKVDTGMHRLGIAATQAYSVFEQLQSQINIDVKVLMSHLACADEIEPSSYRAQLALFDELSQSINISQSLANSAAVIRDTNCHRDYIRPGLALYGVNPLAINITDSTNISLAPTMSLKAPVISIAKVAKGETVGYGDTWTAAKDSTIATVAIGYADGYPREIANGAPVYLNGAYAKLAGRVSMDMLSIDVTDISDVAVGDEVELWGENVDISEIARLSNTVPYTLLCGIGRRVKRNLIG